MGCKRFLAGPLVDFGFCRALLGYYPDFQVARLADCRNSKIRQIIDKLGAAAKIATDRNLNVGERVSKRQKSIPKQIDA